MELVTGGHLQARLKDNGCYNEDQAKLLLGQVLAAVHYLHNI